MIREEWRLHRALYGGTRFLLFPILLSALVLGTTWALGRTETASEPVLAGLHGLLLLFGIQTGTVGLVGREALANLLGDLTPIVAAARTLPVSDRTLLGVFIGKDILFYAGLFVLPIAIGAIPALVGAGYGEIIPLGAAIVGLFLTLLGMFVLGLGLTLAGIALLGAGRPGRIALAVGLIGLVALWVGPVSIQAFTPYGVHVSPTPMRVLGASLPIAGLLLVGLAIAPVPGSSGARRGPRRGGINRLPIGDSVARSSLVVVHRSGGGLLKVIGSAAILLAVAAGAMALAGRVTGLAATPAIAFGAILGLSGFTTYTWLTQFDSVADYFVHPIDMGTVLTGKFRAYLVIGPATGLALYIPTVWWIGSPISTTVTGAVLLLGISVYVFGVTAYLAGLSPNEHLFDGIVFAAFTAAILVALVPIVVIAFLVPSPDSSVLAALGLLAVLLAGVGVWGLRRAGPRWDRRYRR